MMRDCLGQTRSVWSTEIRDEAHTDSRDTWSGMLVSERREPHALEGVDPGAGTPAVLCPRRRGLSLDDRAVSAVWDQSPDRILLADPVPRRAGAGLPGSLAAATAQSAADRAGDGSLGRGGPGAAPSLGRRQVAGLAAATGNARGAECQWDHQDPAPPGYLDRDRPGPHAWQRFEAVQPNDAWQLDFKGPVATPRGLLSPLVVLDDRSRHQAGLTDGDVASLRRHRHRILVAFRGVLRPPRSDTCAG